MHEQCSRHAEREREVTINTNEMTRPPAVIGITLTDNKEFYTNRQQFPSPADPKGL